MKKLKIEAKEFFKNRKYKDAIKKFQAVLMEEPFDLEAKLGVMLCDMAETNEYEAKNLFEMYESAKDKNIGDIGILLEDILQEGDEQLFDEADELKKLYSDELKDYVEYRDFLTFVESRGEFKRAFEDLMFSAKIVIDSKEDFIEFISRLLENGYTNTALNYLENAIALYPHEDFFQKTLGQLEV
ncbi:MAG: hypothetical protein DSZ06_00070 [Sulfurospirillum sp.]|nr:MAG: hypothetical protein DSZ06_00070 [Sulfurospirillum sp.]